MNKKIVVLSITVMFLIILFGMNIFVKTKIPPTISSSSSPVQLKAQSADEEARVKNKQTFEPPEEKAEYDFPLKKDEPLLN